MTNAGGAWEMDVRGVWHGRSIRNLAKGGIKYKPTTGITGDRCVQRYREAVSDKPTPAATSLPHKQQAICARYEGSPAHQVLVATPRPGVRSVGLRRGRAESAALLQQAAADVR